VCGRARNVAWRAADRRRRAPLETADATRNVLSVPTSVRGCLTALAIVLALPSFVGCSRPAPTPRNAIIVVIDALRADHLGCYGYPRPTSPHIDALAAGGTRFANGISTTPWTLPSMATMMTSLYPTVHGAMVPSNVLACVTRAPNCHPVNVLDDSRLTLAEVLQRNGFATAAFVPGRGYTSRVFGFGQGFETFDDDRQETSAIVANFTEWLDQTSPRRFFAYLHLAEVHAPYMGPYNRYRADSPDPAERARAEAIAEEIRRYRGFNFDPDYRGPMDGSIEAIQHLGPTRLKPIGDRDLEHLVALYDQGIAYVDYWIGRLVEELNRRGVLDNTIIFLAADHGDELHDHGGFDHGVTFYEEMMHIPFILRVPHVGTGRVVDEQVGLIDVMPSLLDLLGVHDAADMQGRSIRSLLSGGSLPDRTLFGEAAMINGLTASRTNRWKFIRPSVAPPELYDLTTDPHERVNLCAQDRTPCHPFEEQIVAWETEMKAAKTQRALATPKAAVIDEQTHERLHQLGYE
jgi:arylsulfatase A-like enzyme